MDREYDLEDLLREFSSLNAVPAEPEIPEEPAPAEAAVLSECQPHEEQEASLEETGEPLEEAAPVPAEENLMWHLAQEQETRPASYLMENEEDWEPAEEAPAPKKNVFYEVLMGFAGLIFLGISAIALLWVVLNVHPDAGTATTVAGDTRLSLTENLDIYMNNAASDALGDLAYIRKIYTIEESATIAPVPNPNGFGTTDDPAVIQALIDQAWELLEGQEMVWRPDADFVPGEPMRYYYDETILVIQWKEYIEERCCTCAEVKLAHGSQLRRKLAEDTYGSSVQLYASEMAAASNAVIAINGDFYNFRNLGITAYQRKLYRNNPATVDSCFFTARGDMLFSKAGELMKPGETEKFIKDNDVVFAIAFGPILVDKGELQYCSSYPIGEIDSEYSRSCIAQKDTLHYFLMTINHTSDARPRSNINELACFVHSKDVIKAYTLDGGQTAEIVMMGGPVNNVDFGNERLVSDILYFATAIPSQEVSQ